MRTIVSHLQTVFVGPKAMHIVKAYEKLGDIVQARYAGTRTVRTYAYVNVTQLFN